MSAPNLQTLSDRSLISRLNTLVQREHGSTIHVLHHINEMERRRLYRNYGCASMFTYCTERLHYSASAAARRLRTARAIRRYPRVLELLSRREVNLTTVHMVSGIVFDRDDPSLFERIRGRTQAEVETIVAAYRPKKRLRERVEPVYVACEQPRERPGSLPGEETLCSQAATKKKQTQPADACGGDAERTSPEARNHYRSGSAGAAGGATPGAGTGQGGNPVAPANKAPASQRLEKRYRYQFTVGEGLKRSIDRVRALMSHRIPSNAPMEDVMRILVEAYLDRHCPERKHARREKSTKKRSNGAKPTKPAEPAAPAAPRHRERTTRARCIPAAVRDAVMARAGGRCSFVGPDGVRCTETHRLQIDHIVPVARGGTSAPGNLRVLCGAHNILEAERALGEDVMAPYRRSKDPALIRETGAGYGTSPAIRTAELIRGTAPAVPRNEAGTSGCDRRSAWQEGDAPALPLRQLFH